MLNKILHKKISGVSIQTMLLLTAIALVGFWPISSNLFSLKNDAYIYFLPCRYFISDCIQQGHLPLWNPYFYMGFPLHGDIQGGVWNPIVLIISAFSIYNMTVLQYETLLYILIAGIGMYKLLAAFKASHVTALSLSVCYMFCGFIIDTGQITVWTGSAAFTPFVLLYYHRVLCRKESIYSNAVKTALALYMLLTAGYPSFLIFCGYIMLLAFILKIIYQYRSTDFSIRLLVDLLKANALIVIIFLLIALPALISYIDYFPYYKRSSGTTLAEAQENPFNFFAIISYVFPFSVTKPNQYINTDPTARSAYIGLYTLIFFAGYFRKKWTGFQLFILAVTVFSFLFSLGDLVPVRKFCYRFLPLMNLFRHPGNMRLFTSIGLLLLSSYGMDYFIQSVNNKKAYYFNRLTAISAAMVGVLLMFYFSSSNVLQKTISLVTSFSNTLNKRALVKELYNQLSFADTIILEGLIQLLFLMVLVYCMKKNRIKSLSFLIIFNAVLLAQFSIPATFVSQASPDKINSLIQQSPKGYPIPTIGTSIQANTNIENSTNREFGCAAFYKKQLVQVNEELNPSFTNSLKEFDMNIAISKTVMQYPLCYFADSVMLYKDSLKAYSNPKKILYADTALTPIYQQTAIEMQQNTINIQQFAPWGISMKTSTSIEMPFVLFQNYHANWTLKIDGKNQLIQKGNLSFMYAMVAKGNHLLEWEYHPPYIWYSLSISLITVLGCIIFLIRNRFSTQTSLSLRQPRPGP